jgi:hypothetical protein
MVITEFDAGDPEATMHALADEILKYRRALRLLATAIGWGERGGAVRAVPGSALTPPTLGQLLTRPHLLCGISRMAR